MLKKFKQLRLSSSNAYFIAEIGINHNGELENVFKLIQAAKLAGCDAVKFQKRNPKDCVPKSQWNVLKDTPWGRITYIDYKEKMEFSKKDYKKIIDYCKKTEIDWFASCWDISSVYLMEELKIPCYKIASASLTDLNLIKEIKKTNKPVILSTGASTLKQIKTAVKILGQKNLAILHCNSSYPANYEELNLNMIKKFKKIFPKSIIGYSGHEIGLSPSSAAVVLGAKIIERHITLDKSMWGTDQQASIEPLGFARLIKDIKTIEKSMGVEKKIVYVSEKKVMKKLRIND